MGRGLRVGVRARARVDLHEVGYTAAAAAAHDHPARLGAAAGGVGAHAQ